MQKRSELFWNVTQPILVINDISIWMYCPETSVTTEPRCVTSQKSQDICSLNCLHFSRLWEKLFFSLVILCWYSATTDPPDLSLKQSYVCQIVLQFIVNKCDIYSLQTFPVTNLVLISRCICRFKIPIQVPDASISFFNLRPIHT